MLIFIVFAFVCKINSQIIGLDFGTQWIKFAEFQNSKGFVVLEDKMSKRKTYNLVSFCNGHPLYEYQGYQSFFKKKCITLCGTSQYLYNNEVQEDVQSEDFEMSQNQRQKDLIFQDKQLSKFLQLKSEKIQLSLQEIQALILKNIKSNVKHKSKNIAPQLMMTVPQFELDIFQRKSLKYLMQLSGFNPIGIIHENSAAALYYTYDRLKSMNQKSQQLLIVNIGYQFTKLSLFQITSNKKKDVELIVIKTNKHLTSQQFSGQKLNQCLSKLVPNLQGKSKEKKRQVLKAIEEVKIKLSVNKEQRISVNDYEDGKKFSQVVKREQFYEICKEKFKILKDILLLFKHSFLQEENGLNLQVIGGTVRVPKVKQILQEIFQTQINNHINGDDGPALGATLQATKIIINSYEKNIVLRENLNYDYSIKFENQQDQKIFKNSIFQGKESQFQIPFVNELKFQIKDSLQNQILDYQIKKIEIENLKEGKIQFDFFIDHFGLLQIKQIKLVGSQEIEKDGKKTQKNIQKILDYFLKQINEKSILDQKENLTESSRLLKKITFQEEQKQYMGKIRNELESLLFQAKEIIKEEEKRKFLKKEEIENLQKKIKQIKKFVESEDFSYDDEKINKKIGQMKQVLQPYKLRSSENKLRQTTIEEHDAFLNKCLEIVNNIRKIRYWVPPYLINEQQQIFQYEIEQFQLLKQKQQAQKIDEDPIIISEEIKNKKEFLKSHLQQLTTFPKNRKINSFHYLIQKFVKAHNISMEELMKKQLQKITGQK